MSWATIQQVTNLTGKTVNATQLAQASATIELHTGAIEAVERVYLSVRDAYWLRLAVCYQAAWQTPTPDFFERMDVTSASQDGQSASYTADSLTLAPLARRAIRRLSWKGTRTLMPAGSMRPEAYNPLVSDENQAWRPL